MMMKATAQRQRGIGFVGFILIGAGIIFAAVAGMKLVPPYLHSAQIAEIFKSIARDPNMQGASINDIKMAYAKRANVNYITDVSPEDIEIDKDNGRLVLSTSYSVKIPVAGNITLLLEFNPSSS
jgi:hypothetical protein